MCLFIYLSIRSLIIRYHLSFIFVSSKMRSLLAMSHCTSVYQANASRRSSFVMEQSTALTDLMNQNAQHVSPSLLSSRTWLSSFIERCRCDIHSYLKRLIANLRSAYEMYRPVVIFWCKCGEFACTSDVR